MTILLSFWFICCFTEKEGPEHLRKDWLLRNWLKHGVPKIPKRMLLRMFDSWRIQVSKPNNLFSGVRFLTTSDDVHCMEINPFFFWILVDSSVLRFAVDYDPQSHSTKYIAILHAVPRNDSSVFFLNIYSSEMKTSFPRWQE